MTVATTTNKAIATGNGLTTTFPFTFGTLPTGDIVVSLFDLSGTEFPQVQGADFNVLGEGAEDGGAVTFTSAPASGWIVLIQRIIPITQPTDFKNQGSFYPRTFERAYDRDIMIAQQLHERISSALTLPPQVEGVSPVLPSPLASNLIGWDALAGGLANYSLSDLATSITYGNKTFQTFVGDGVQTVFVLSQDPGSLGNLDVSIDGVTQVNGADFNYSGTSLTLTSAPANGAVVLVRFDQAVPTGVTAASSVNYTPPGGVGTSVGAALDAAVKNNTAQLPVNTEKLWMSPTSWNPDTDRIYGRSTPQTAIVAVGAHLDMMGGPSVGYQWGINSWLTNPNTAPFTNIDAVAQGWKPRGMGATARQCGDNGDGHAIEIISGQWAAAASVTTANASPVLAVNDVTFKGGKFCVGNAISGTNIPGGATILSVTKDGVTVTGSSADTADHVNGGAGYQVGDILTVVGGTSTFPAQIIVLAVSGGAVTNSMIHNAGNYTVAPANPVAVTGGAGAGATFNLGIIKAGFGYPDTITISANATGAGTSEVEVLGPSNQNIGVLISGSGNGGADGTGNPEGRAIQVQSYGSAAFKYVLNMSGSAMRTDGTGIRFATVTAERGMSFESCNLAQGINASGGSYSNFMLLSGLNCSGSMLSIGSVTASVGLNFASTNTFSQAAINLSGQNISSDSTTGAMLGTSATQKWGFWGATPVVRPTVTGSRGGNAALASLLTALASAGLIVNNSTA